MELISLEVKRFALLPDTLLSGTQSSEVFYCFGDKVSKEFKFHSFNRISVHLDIKENSWVLWVVVVTQNFWFVIIGLCKEFRKCLLLLILCFL